MGGLSLLLVAIGVVAIAAGIAMIGDVIRMRVARGHWPWAVEVPIMCGLAEIALGVIALWAAGAAPWAA